MTTPAQRTADEAIATVSEFPEWLGPVLIKELRQGLRSGLFVIPFLVLPAALALVTVWALAVASTTSARNTVSGFFWVAVIVPVLVITPLRALGAIRSEREAQTIDLLQLTPLTAWRIVVAKWSSLVVQSALWVVALLPFFVLRYFFGRVNLTEEIFGLVLFVAGGAALTAIAVVISTLPRLMFWLSIAALAFLSIWSFGFLFVSLFSRSLFSGLLGASGPTSSWPVFLLIDGLLAHVTVLALVLAAARIAPMADNYAVRLRLGALALFGWWGIAASALPAGMGDAPWFFFAFALIVTGVLSAYELVSDRPTLAGQVRAWNRLGAAGRLLAASFLPGWPSALVFASGTVAVATGAVLATMHTNYFRFAVVGLLAWSAIVLPRGIQCMTKRNGVERPGLHFLLHLGGGLLAGILAMFMIAVQDAVVLPAALFPSALFWLSLGQFDRASAEFGLIGGIAIVWVVLLGSVCVAHSRAYWKAVKRQAAP